MKSYAFLASILLAFSSHTLANTFDFEYWTTKNGVQVVFYPAMEVPMLDISLAFAAGSAYDKNNYGLGALTAQMLNEGSAGIDSTAIAEQLAETGAQFDISTSRDMAVFNLRTLSSKEALSQASATFAQIINHPDFPDQAMEQQKKQLLMAIEQSNESPDDIAMQAFFNHLYQQHPYAHPVNGTQASMSALTKDQVVHFYRQYYLANNAVLVMVGAIDSPTAHQLADKLTHELPKGAPAPAIGKAIPLTQQKQVNIPFPSSQTVVRMGQTGIDHHNPYYFPLIVGNYILGGGNLLSRLGTEVREQRGLTYAIDSQFVPMPGYGPFLISLSTKNSKAQQAIKVTQQTLERFIIDGPKQEEVEAAKHYLTGSFPLSLASNRTIANLLVRMTFYHLPRNYLDTYVEQINKVTAAEIKQAFQAQVHPHQLLLVTVGHL